MSEAAKWTRLVCGIEWTKVGEFYVSVSPHGTVWKFEISGIGCTGSAKGTRSNIDEAKRVALLAVPSESPPSHKAFAVKGGWFPAINLPGFPDYDSFFSPPRREIVATVDIPPAAKAIVAESATEVRCRTAAHTKALRAALPSIDALTWPAADKRALCTAARSLVELAEVALEDLSPKMGVSWAVSAVLGAVCSAEHLGPALAMKDVQAALDMARETMSRKQ